MPSDNVKSYLHLHLIVFIWGFTAILGALISLEALSLVWFRMLFAAFFVLLYIFYSKKSLKVSIPTLLQFLVAGLVIAVHWFTFFKAIKLSNVSLTLACLSTGAFFASIIEPIVLGKKVNWYDVIFGLIVVVGLYFIALSTHVGEGSLFNSESNNLLAIGLALFSAFLSALFAVINSRFVKKHDSTIISFYELLGGVVFFSLFIMATEGFSTSFFDISTNDFLLLLILSTICTAYAFIASTQVMRYLSPYTVMLTINLEPVYGIILAVILFKEKETMTPMFYFGAVIIILTVIVNTIMKTRK
jgi:drug/metabolite transporter (DMT)-like permease